MSATNRKLNSSQRKRVLDTGKVDFTAEYVQHNPDGTITLKIPSYFGIYSDNTVVFERCLRLFDWSIKDKFVCVDFSECRTAGHQAITLLALYLMQLKKNGCSGEVIFTQEKNSPYSDVRKLWINMGVGNWPIVLRDSAASFITRDDHPLYAVRDYDDFNITLEKFGADILNYDMSYSKTLRHVVSELLYNAIEHGCHTGVLEENVLKFPALMSYYHAKKTNELNIIIADTGIGIKSHLKQFIPDLESDVQAIVQSLKPKVSGTFGVSTPYSPRNNAGMGLYISSGLIRNLRADMYVVSGNGAIHISPSDTTQRTMAVNWPGTAVFLNIRLGSAGNVNAAEIMDKIYQAAQDEINQEAERNDSKYRYFNMQNYFGRYAENKGEAISFRDKHLLPTLRDGKYVKLDFDEIESSPHSFLNAMFASVVREFGEKVYRIVKVINAQPQIKDVIEYIIEDNLNDD